MAWVTLRRPLPWSAHEPTPARSNDCDDRSRIYGWRCSPCVAMSGQNSRKTLARASAPQGICVLDGELFAGVALARVISGRDALGDAAAQHLRNIEGIVPVIVTGDENARGSVGTALPEPTLAHGKVTLVLGKNGGQDKNHPVVAIRLIDKAAPGVRPVTADAFTEFWVGVCCLRHSRGDAHKDER